MLGDSCTDCKQTLRLPRTRFPIRPDRSQPWVAGVSQLEVDPDADRASLFVLHDGPPYANGHLHLGHALNKILKDIIVRWQRSEGRSVSYVPGWDCHGLPIEWKVEEQCREQGLEKDAIPPAEFRDRCRRFAQKWVAQQALEFKSLGIMADWRDPYTTMTSQAEASIARAFFDLLERGYVYRGLKPVMWSVAERTALAEAEVEYIEKSSTAVFVSFPLVDEPDISAVVWTTTPWTIPANRMVAFAPHLRYGLYRVDEKRRFILAIDLAKNFQQAAGLPQMTFLGEVGDPGRLVSRHPLSGCGYGEVVRFYSASFVTKEVGTGFVHVAPEHGPDDYDLAVENGIPIPTTIGPDSAYLPHVPVFSGLRVLNDDGREGPANEAVVQSLTRVGTLVARSELRHSYPHSWRSKSPVIYRTTPQFFIRLKDIRPKALRALERVAFTPELGRRRLVSMIKNRPDGWVVSRQRIWGVPLGIFIHKVSGDILLDAALNSKIVRLFCENGSDVWFERDAAFFLEGCVDSPEDYEKVPDILDVWFDSGCSQDFVLRRRNLFPADLYLEGSDQHRGWFQSSLLCACAREEESGAPYKRVLTHGFVVDESGRKMSKSLGNVLSPRGVIDQYGPDVLRVWVASSDYAEDLRIGQSVLAGCAESYRKLRNTFRFLLGNLAHRRAARYISDHRGMPHLERWLLNEIARADLSVRQAYEDCDFKRAFHVALNFCTHQLSSVYFDIRKDCLYCDALDSPKWHACQTVLEVSLSALLTWLGPIVPFVVHEVRESLPDRVSVADPSSGFMAQESWMDTSLGDVWESVFDVRRAALLSLEHARRDGLIGSGLEANLVISTTPEVAERVSEIDLAEVTITSGVVVKRVSQPQITERIKVEVKKALGQKCARCWKVLPEVRGSATAPGLCQRCSDIVGALAQNA